MIGRVRPGDWVEVRWWNGEFVRPRLGQVVKIEQEREPSGRRSRHYVVEFLDTTRYVYQRGHLHKKMGGRRPKVRA